MFKVIHRYTGLIYSGLVTVELLGFSSVNAAIAAAEARCLDFGGSYDVVLA